MNNSANIVSSKRLFQAAALSVMALWLVAMPELAMAQGQDVSGAQTTVKGFFDNLNTLLNVASVAIVTIAIIFAGYQVAFNHKRLTDVAMVLVGGFLIGAAAQLAKMVLPSDMGAGGGASGSGSGGMASTVEMVAQLLQYA